MHLSCGGIFNDHFITHLLLSLLVKEFWKKVDIWKSYGQEDGVLFLTHGVYSSYILAILATETNKCDLIW